MFSRCYQRSDPEILEIIIDNRPQNLVSKSKDLPLDVKDMLE